MNSTEAFIEIRKRLESRRKAYLKAEARGGRSVLGMMSRERHLTIDEAIGIVKEVQQQVSGTPS